MVCCAVKCCKNNTNKKSLKGKAITYHSFPNDSHTNKKWVKATGRDKSWSPDIHSKICSIHFTDDCFDISPKGRRKIIPPNIPTLYLEEIFHIPAPFVSTDSAPGDTSAVKVLKLNLLRARKLCMKRRVDIKRLTARNCKLQNKVIKLETALKELMKKVLIMRKKHKMTKL